MTRAWRRTATLVAVLALAVTACGGDEEPAADGDSTGTASGTAVGEGGDPSVPDGPTITVGSFNFGESQILGNIYAIALQEAGYPVETKLDLGAREVILPELEAGNIDLLPEYVGSALAVGFGGEPTGELEASLGMLRSEFEALGVTVLEPAPGEDKNAFAVTAAFAQEHGLESVADLADVPGEVTFAGPPECETRSTCLLALTETYGLGNIAFEAIQEGGVRVAALANGEVDVALLFSTQPVIAQEGFVVLDDPQGAIPVENIVPVVSNEVIEAYGGEFRELLNSLSERITTETLIELNGRVELDAEDPEDVARAWLEEHDLI